MEARGIEPLERGVRTHTPVPSPPSKKACQRAPSLSRFVNTSSHNSALKNCHYARPKTTTTKDQHNSHRQVRNADRRPSLVTSLAGRQADGPVPGTFGRHCGEARHRRRPCLAPEDLNPANIQPRTPDVGERRFRGRGRVKTHELQNSVGLHSVPSIKARS
jgi:hypothetical protein